MADKMMPKTVGSTVAVTIATEILTPNSVRTESDISGMLTDIMVTATKLDVGFAVLLMAVLLRRTCQTNIVWPLIVVANIIIV